MRDKSWLALAAVGLGLMVFGFSADEAEIVFRKAAVICMECIGLG